MFKKTSWRNDVEDYIKGFKMMLHFEEEDQARYLDRFNLKDVQITYHMERKFFFPLTVSSAWKWVDLLFRESIIIVGIFRLNANAGRAHRIGSSN